jgi:hypothetical protein
MLLHLRSNAFMNTKSQHQFTWTKNTTVTAWPLFALFTVSFVFIIQFSIFSILALFVAFVENDFIFFLTYNFHVQKFLPLFYIFSMRSESPDTLHWTAMMIINFPLNANFICELIAKFKIVWKLMVMKEALFFAVHFNTTSNWISNYIEPRRNAFFTIWNRFRE